MATPEELEQQEVGQEWARRYRLAQLRLKCIEAIFNGGSNSQRENHEAAGEKLYNFVIKGLFEQEETKKP